MAYELNTNKNLVTIFDIKTGQKIDFTVLDLTTDDKMKFRSESLKVQMRAKDSLENDKLKFEWGEKIILGLTKRYFTINDKPVSTDPSDTQDKYDNELKDYNEKLEKFEKSSPEEKAELTKPVFEGAVYYPGWYAVLKTKRPDLIWKIVEHQLGDLSFVIKEEQLPFVAN